ncbi:chorismate mutase [Actinomycetospora straminea]|uniref:Chorismate mutase domain-containing protein n=1 Tax=Actinomycetospora straminea TaxID=663607 RepID=A0ABP9EAJ3_9PSEU|nr:chorismate mutase [Actinomycetospora straminea]MDD7931944.1 chorismate mutase [Actinomycetospora straminea]
MSLDEVRAAIDRIDDQIVVLLAQRQEQVRAAAAFKSDDAAVRAPARRAAVIARLRQRAEEEGVHPDVVAATYTAMIDAFIALELGVLHAHEHPG